jgi:hypothetical protein
MLIIRFKETAPKLLLSTLMTRVIICWWTMTVTSQKSLAGIIRYASNDNNEIDSNSPSPAWQVADFYWDEQLFQRKNFRQYPSLP